MLAVTSQAEATRVLGLHSHTVAKLKDAAVLVGPPDRPERRTGIYASSLETAAAVLPTAITKGDIAIHVAAYDPSDHHAGRSGKGWHQEKCLALSLSQRRACWSGIWEMDRAKALAHVGHHAVATVGGFIVDIAGVAGASLCPCCGLIVFDLQNPDSEAVARYRGRRMTVPQGSMWTT